MNLSAPEELQQIKYVTHNWRWLKHIKGNFFHDINEKGSTSVFNIESMINKCGTSSFFGNVQLLRCVSSHRRMWNNTHLKVRPFHWLWPVNYESNIQIWPSTYWKTHGCRVFQQKKYGFCLFFTLKSFEIWLTTSNKAKWKRMLMNEWIMSSYTYKKCRLIRSIDVCVGKTRHKDAQILVNTAE